MIFSAVSPVLNVIVERLVGNTSANLILKLGLFLFVKNVNDASEYTGGCLVRLLLATTPGDCLDKFTYSSKFVGKVSPRIQS
jgi:hypothetical protein